MRKIIHGGNKNDFADAITFNRDEIIDFSANINPLGISSALKQTLINSIDELVEYPDPEYLQLKNAIAHHFNVMPDEIIVGNGSVQLIFEIATAIAPKFALVLAPTFGEYERALLKSGAQTVIYPLNENQHFKLDIGDLITYLVKHPEIDLICLGNPNNPTAQYLNQTLMAQLVRYCNQHQIYLIIDEAFMDFITETRASYVDCLRMTDHCAIIRSATKYFAVPGLRLGFAIIKQRQLNRQINDQMEPWSVNSLANCFGQVMFEDQTYFNQTKRWFETEHRVMELELDNIGFLTVMPSQVNFFLVKSQNHKLKQELQLKGIMIRSCTDFIGIGPGYFRIALKQHQDNKRLISVLQKLDE